ncbi:MAG: hypothetical protein A3I61_05150 [Acidobacteria bacterium RIFCSPLOWO2_02_FULL_68_18]|nr:MAG: hypothetical protein A3I61_05150 [Acidobacteria bacterium RIFCSPLOWO2_02_FULL_68_18]OFW49232.1 MAG: hypothetical protein A3G77_03955 [Acidobacteria bacterium RIFCSPLOWO2_12_FULL_68_19]
MIRTARRVVIVGVAAWLLSPAPTLIGEGDPGNVGFIGAYKVAREKIDPSQLPFIGAWRINLAKSDPAIQPRFTPTAMNIFIAENGGIRQEVYQDYPPKVNTVRTVFDERVLYRVSPDGRTLVWTNFANVTRDSGQNVWDRVDMPSRPQN